MKRPFSRIEVCGIVTNKKLTKSKCIITVDDGTGEVECVHDNYQHGDMIFGLSSISNIALGDLVVLRGTIQLKHSAFLPSMSFAAMNMEPRYIAIGVTHIEIVRDVSFENKFWSRCIKLHNEEYSMPLSPPSDNNQ